MGGTVARRLLRRLIYPALARSGWFRRFRNAKRNRAATIVTYHGVLPSGYAAEEQLDGHLVTVAALREQLRFLKAGYTLLSPGDLESSLDRGRDLPPGSVLVTCDDGLTNHVTDMLPILEEEGVRCLFFVTAAGLAGDPGMLWFEELHLLLGRAAGKDLPSLRDLAIDGPVPTDEGDRRRLWSRLVRELSHVDAGPRRARMDLMRCDAGLSPDWARPYLEDAILRRRFLLLSAEQVRQLVDSNMTVGSHSVSHPMLSYLPEEAALREIASGRTALEETAGVRAWAHAYPFGDPESVSPREVALAPRTGHKCALLNHPGNGAPGVANRFALPRVHLTRDMELSELEARLSGFHAWVQALFRRGAANATSVR